MRLHHMPVDTCDRRTYPRAVWALLWCIWGARWSRRRTLEETKCFFALIAVRRDEVIHPCGPRREDNGALRACHRVGGAPALSAPIDICLERGCLGRIRAKTATLVHRRVEDAMQVTPVRGPVCTSLASQAIEDAHTSKVFGLGSLESNHLPTMRLARFQLCRSFRCYFCFGDAQYILVPEGVSRGAFVCCICGCVCELVSWHTAVAKYELETDLHTPAGETAECGGFRAT